MPTNIATLTAEAARVKANGPKRPGTASRPTPKAVLPAFMQGSMRAAWAGGAPRAPAGNVASLRKAFNMPEHTTAMFRDSPAYRAFGPLVGPRPGQVVGALQGVDGWFDVVKDVAKSVIPQHTVVGKILGGNTQGAIKDAGKLVQGAIAPKPPPAPVAQPTQVEQVFQSMRPQNDTQKWMMVGAGVLGLGLIAMLIKRR